MDASQNLQFHIIEDIMDDDDMVNAMVFDSSSEDEQQQHRERRAPNKDRNFDEAYKRVMRNYFSGACCLQ